MAAVIFADFNFQIGSIAENVLHDLYYNYANFHTFTTFWTIVLKICTNRLHFTEILEDRYEQTMGI